MIPLSRRIRISNLRQDIAELARRIDLHLAELQVAETKEACDRAMAGVGDTMCAIADRFSAFASDED